MAMLRVASVVVPALLACSGCHSMGETRSTYVPPRSSSHVASIQTDSEYVQRVEQQARTRGIGVTWINPPVKRVAATDTP